MPAVCFKPFFVPCGLTRSYKKNITNAVIRIAKGYLLATCVIMARVFCCRWRFAPSGFCQFPVVFLRSILLIKEKLK
jgi:hypothetical protein